MVRVPESTPSANENDERRTALRSDINQLLVPERELPMKRLAVVGSVVVLLAAVAGARDERPAKAASIAPDALKAQIEALKSSRVAWRAIAWKSCLLEGLKESRVKNKPVLLWVFIDRPIDDARC
jgi:hypothetical protein